MHIVVAVDRSEESENALATAIDVTESTGGTVTAVHVVESEPSAPVSDGSAEDGRNSGEEVLREAEKRASERNSSIETELLDGDPVEAIAEYAEANDADVIYVGHRGLTSEDESEEISEGDRGALGSVAKGLVQRTRVPVSIFDREV